MDNADERRIPRGGSLQESKFQVWPAAIRPQTPAVPGTKRPPGFGRHSGASRRLNIYQDGYPVLGRHGRVPRDTPNTVGQGLHIEYTGRREAKLQQMSFSECDAGTE